MKSRLEILDQYYRKHYALQVMFSELYNELSKKDEEIEKLEKYIKKIIEICKRNYINCPLK